MGCGPSKRDDVAAGNTIARKSSSIRNSWRRNKDAASVAESAEERSQKSVDGKSKEGENVEEEKKVGPVTEQVKTEHKKEEEKVTVAAAPEIKEETVVAEAKLPEAPVAETKGKETTVHVPVPVAVIVKVEEKREEPGKGEVEEKKEAPVVKVEEIKEDANVAQEKENATVVEEINVVGKGVEEVTGADEKVQAVEENVAEKDVNENKNVEVVEEKATPVMIPQIKVEEEPKQEAESVKSENSEEKQEEQQAAVEKATKEEAFLTPVGGDKLSIEKVEIKSSEKSNEEAVEEVKTA